jgi:hypothetical protein
MSFERTGGLQFGLRAVLIQNRQTGHYFVLLVEQGREVLFRSYLASENLRIVRWLDSEDACRTIDQNIAVQR